MSWGQTEGPSLTLVLKEFRFSYNQNFSVSNYHRSVLTLFHRVFLWLGLIPLAWVKPSFFFQECSYGHSWEAAWY